MAERILKITEDGSPTFYVPKLNESFHSKHGAILESKYVFVDRGFRYWCELNASKSKVDILEIGLGTGLNFLLTAHESKRKDKKLFYQGIDAYPLDSNELMSFAKLISFDHYFTEQQMIDFYQLSWEKWHQFEANIRIQKLNTKVQEFSMKKSYDLIYYDAFGRFAQPELWDEEILVPILNKLNQNGVFVTYAAFGDLRRNLTKMGLKVERLPGAPGKREMTRSAKI